PVPAGFDMFPPGLMERYMGRTASEIGLGFDEFARLGRREKENPGDSFNMANLAMENSTHVNGVSELHAEVTRGMFSHRWPSYPEDEVPIDAITNGIHTTTWIGRRIAGLLDEYCGPAWRREPERAENWVGVKRIPDEELWAEKENQRGELVRFVRRHLQKQQDRRGGALGFDSVNAVLDPRILTIGFARRFATYKRGTLMISDPERLKRILNHPERPVQIVISGKAHPRDDGGKGLIQALVRFIAEHNLGTRMVFLEDYDMQVARRLVQGVDVWLNNPRRPYEASGTSGMKVVPNGGLNLSVLDGWWDEGYEPGVGWTIGDRESDPDAGHQDWLDGRALYDTIENEIAPAFYHRIESGLPLGWLKMMRRSMMRLAPRFSTSRMVQDYAERFYIPASAAYTSLATGDLSRAQEALAWRDRVKTGWPTLGIA
ncbi:alpha-glucan family phosphorylase, partial [bacterium]